MTEKYELAKLKLLVELLRVLTCRQRFACVCWLSPLATALTVTLYWFLNILRVCLHRDTTLDETAQELLGLTFVKGFAFRQFQVCDNQRFLIRFVYMLSASSR